MDIGKIVAQVAAGAKAVDQATSYCDFVAHTCAVALSHPNRDRIIKTVGPIRWDLHPAGGYLVSTKKTIDLEGFNGRRYRVSIEEIQP